MSKLFVAGCSFSDYTKVDEVYGELLAEKLGYEYVHEGAGCGSNWRIWRRITQHIIDGNLTPDDLLIVQYTTIERCEFWSSFDQPRDSYGFKGNKEKLPIIEKSHDDGFITRFKMDSCQWQNNDTEKEFQRLYQNYFLNSYFEWDKFIAHNYNFQYMLLAKHIPTVFINTWRNNVGIWKNENTLLEEFKPYMFMHENMDSTDSRYNLEPGDYGHMSQEGHKIFADKLFAHINKVGLNRGT